MMNKATVLFGLLSLALLAGCSKSETPPTPAEAVAAKAAAQPQSAASDDEAEAPPAPTPEQVAAAEPHKDRAKLAQGLMTLLSNDPKCQSFRDQLEAAGRTPADQPLPVEMSHIVALAHEAGCTNRK